MRRQLREIWSLMTAKQWSAQTPAAGQCNVTAVAIQDIFGGEICLTPLADFPVPHFYNVFEGQRVDLTDSQFTQRPEYADTPATRAHAMKWVTQTELATLKDALRAGRTQN